MSVRRQAIWIAIAALLAAQVAHARLDHGGWMSRDLDMGIVDGVETVYATTVSDGDERIGSTSCEDACGTGNCDDEPMTLWAFCADGICAGVDSEDLDCQDPEGVTSGDESCVLCAPPCKWRRPLCGSLGTTGVGHDPSGLDLASYVPPVVSNDGARIFTASVNGKIYAYDHTGDLVWTEDEPGAKFYARPALDEWLESGCLRRTLYLLSQAGDLYAFEAGDPPGETSCQSLPDPGTKKWEHHVDDGPFLFEPIVDADGQDPGCPLLYVGSEDPVEGLLALDTCATGGADPVGTLWRCHWKNGGAGDNGAPATLSFKLGGTILEDDGLRILSANAEQGTVAIDLENPPTTEQCGWNQSPPNKELWFRKAGTIGSQDERTHRSYPTTSRTDRDPNRPTVYMTGKGGAIIQLDALDGTNPWSGDGTEYLFPRTGGIPDVSFSSATASPHSGHLFFGPAKDEGVYKVDPRMPPASAPAWFDYVPEDDWRTTPSFSDLDRRVHIGSAKSILYTLDSDPQCGLAEWCWDARKAGELSEEGKYAGGRCQALASNPTDLADTPCCADLAAEQIEDACRCYDNEDEIPCNVTKISAPYDELLTRPSGAPWDELVFDDYQLNHPGLVSVSGGLYRVILILDYLVDDSSDLGAANPGEAMNESTGVIGSTTFCPSPWPCTQAFWFGAVDLAEGDNEIRLSLYDDAGNESFARVKIKDVPLP